MSAWHPTPYALDGEMLLRMSIKGRNLYLVDGALVWDRRGLPQPYASPEDFRREGDGREFADVREDLEGMTPEERAGQAFRLWIME
jgi:hypothetical protein